MPNAWSMSFIYKELLITLFDCIELWPCWSMYLYQNVVSTWLFYFSISIRRIERVSAYNYIMWDYSTCSTGVPSSRELERVFVWGIQFLYCILPNYLLLRDSYVHYICDILPISKEKKNIYNVLSIIREFISVRCTAFGSCFLCLIGGRILLHWSFVNAFTASVLGLYELKTHLVFVRSKHT